MKDSDTRSWVSGVIGSLIIFLTLGCVKEPILETPPDIVVIIADDIGYSDFGCYGGETGTPEIDKLAANGIRFTQFYVENMCNPTRTALLTGQYHLKGYSNPHNITIAEGLAMKGYKNYAVGKWHNYGENFDKYDARNAPRERGFDHFYGTPMGAGSFFAPLRLSRDGQDIEEEWQNDEDFYYTDAIADNAVRYISQAPPDTPLYLHVAFTAAHWPLHAKEEDIKKQSGKYDIGWDSLRGIRYERMKQLGVISPDTRLSERDPNVPAWEDVEDKAWQVRRMEVYAAQISSMDRGIGRIMEALKSSGRLENTLLMIMVDNGGCHVEYDTERKGSFLNDSTRDGRPLVPGNIPGLMPGTEETFQSYGYGWANLSNTPFRLFKQYSHEGGIKVPLIVHWPAAIPGKGLITGEVAHVTDILPTLFDAAGVQYPEKFQDREISPPDGRSMLPLLQGKETGERQYLCWSHNHGQAVRKGKWKLVRQDKRPWELYDLIADPSERNDLAEKNHEIVIELEALFQQWLKEQENGFANL